MSRYPVTNAPRATEEWTLERVTPPSRLFGANGLRTGDDGRIYVAQVTGSQISAIDIDTRAVETICARGGDIIAPDDIAFDAHGNLYATEVMDGRVSVRESSGQTRVLRDDIPCANGITVHQGRLFVGECRVGGRLLELDTAGGAPRVILADVPMPNAMEFGPDGLLYFPVMGTNEIWRVRPEGGAAEKVADQLGVPDSVKFDAKGRIVSTQVHSGEVLRIDPSNGERTVLARLHPSLDNLTFVGQRLFVSNFSGEITEILDDQRTRTLLPAGLNWPLGMTVDAQGRVYIADGTNLYVLEADGALRSIGTLFSPGYPGFIRGLVATGAGEFVVTTAGGQISRYRPQSEHSEILAQGLDQLYGVAVAPGGTVFAAELGTGSVIRAADGQAHVLASGLRDPMGVAIDADGSCLVSESAGGCIQRITPAGARLLIDGLQRPQGVCVRDGRLYIADAGAKSILAVDLRTGVRRTLAENLPLGSPAGVVPKPLRGLPPFSGPQGPFADLAFGDDGCLYLGADGDGSILALRPRTT